MTQKAPIIVPRDVHSGACAGCETRGPRTYQCSYHEGYADGLASATGANRSAASTAPESWSIVIPGRAVPKARPRVTGGRAYTPERTRDWEERVGWAWRAAHGQTLLTGSLAVELMFVGRHRGDADNLAKGVLDALNGVAYGDDRQVDELHVRRLASRDEEYVAMTVRRLLCRHGRHGKEVSHE